MAAVEPRFPRPKRAADGGCVRSCESDKASDPMRRVRFWRLRGAGKAYALERAPQSRAGKGTGLLPVSG